jgi:arabinogalactan oligomer / maltooligosaccharide transport system substrate-binding protein
VIWADDLVSVALQPFADDFGDQNEVNVAVQEVPGDEIRDRLVTAGPAGEGPDLIVGAHDWLGELVANGVISPVDLTGVQDQMEEVAVEAFTFDAQTYGLPYATENIGLYRNTELVPDVPATWEELEEIAQQLEADGEVREGIVWPTEPPDPYHNYPIVTAYGGYVFGTADDGSLDTSDIGIDSEGAIQAGDKLAEMVSSGLLSADIGYQLMVDLFSGGDAAFAITGPWALGDMEGPEFEVTPIPDIDGNTPRPFVGVQGFMVSAFAENELLAQTFLLDFMATEDAQVQLYEAASRPPALTSALEQVADDPDIQGFADAGAEGEPMPAIPEMASVFDAWTSAYELIYEGAQEPADALSDAAEQLRSVLG